MVALRDSDHPVDRLHSLYLEQLYHVLRWDSSRGLSRHFQLDNLLLPREYLWQRDDDGFDRLVEGSIPSAHLRQLGIADLVVFREGSAKLWGRRKHLQLRHGRIFLHDVGAPVGRVDRRPTHLRIFLSVH